MNTEYKPSPASLFATHARESKSTGKVKWMWCPTCGTQTDHDYTRTHGVYEDYRCQSCGITTSMAVR